MACVSVIMGVTTGELQCSCTPVWIKTVFVFFFLTEEVISVFIVIYTQNHLESRKSLLKFKECLDNALKHVV